MMKASASLQKSGPSTAGTRAGQDRPQRLATIVQNKDQPAVAAALFPQIDTARIARDLKIETIARDRGRHDLPETRDNSLDAMEQKIIQEMEGERARQGDELLNSLRRYAARLVSYSIPGKFLRLQIQADHVLAWLRVATGQALRNLTPLQERYACANDELEQFKKRNHLSRPPREPSHLWSTLGLLFILVAIESVLGGFVFAESSEFGAVSAFGTAIGISLTSVALSFLLGLGPSRWRNHRRSFISRSGLLITIAGFSSIVVLHLCAAQLRVVTGPVAEGKTFAAVWEAIQRAPWAVPDIASACLVGMGSIFALGAIWKGHCFDDPYPRYGAACRRKTLAWEEYSNAYFDLFNELSNVKEDTVAQLNDGIARLPQFREMAVDVRAQRAAMLNSFRAYETSVETATNQLLRLYRDINHAQRATAPPPHFDEKWQLPHSFLLSPELKSLLVDPEMGDVASSLTELERLSKAIITRYELLRERYPHPSEVD
jgi:hypothetical protein